MKITPRHLVKGDTVGLIALSSKVQMEKLSEATAFLEELGLSYKIGKTIGAENRYFAGTDEEKIADFHAMIEDPEIKAIFCVRGGYGMARIAEKIDYELLAENPKIVWGFSDVTYLHTAINEFSDLVTFHGPMLMSSVKMDDLSKKMFLQLFSPMEVQYTEHISPLTTLVPGVARGILTGGNLTRIVNSLGTKFEIRTEGKLLFIEDIGEALPRIDVMLQQLKQARKFDQVAGVVVGSFTNTEADEAALMEVLQEYFGTLGVPVVAGFKMGHDTPNFAIPLGVEAILDAQEKVLRILPGVQ
ncbi:MAG: LD-carboxypeptidase [Lysinibacillus sp.]